MTPDSSDPWDDLPRLSDPGFPDRSMEDGLYGNTDANADRDPSEDRRPQSGRRSRAHKVELWALMLASVGLGIAGFTLPWVSLDRGSVGQVGYGAINLPVGGDLGAAWWVALLLVAVVAWLAHRRWVLVFGFILSLWTVAVLLVLAIIVHLGVHLLPLWLIPRHFRPDIPALGSGAGPYAAVASSVLLAVWFIVAAIMRPTPAAKQLGPRVRRLEQRGDRVAERAEARFERFKNWKSR